jgi:hypothetical protein
MTKEIFAFNVVEVEVDQRVLCSNLSEHECSIWSRALSQDGLFVQEGHLHVVQMRGFESFGSGQQKIYRKSHVLFVGHCLIV